MLIELATAVHQAANTCTATALPAACQPSWLDTGSNSWQLTAATFVGLMSVPGLAVLYGGLVPKKWVVNTMFMAFSGFSAVLIVWVLWAYKMGFGSPVGGGTANTWNYTYGSNFFKNFFDNFVGHPETSLRGTSETSQATLTANGGTSLPLSQATAALFYFQFVFAAITPLLFLGSVIGRIKIKVWIIFVPLWTTFVYAVNAMLIWGGGYWAHEGAVDYSGGYVIHLAAGTSGFVAAWVIGPRLARDRAKFIPHSLPLVSIGAGIIWLGWNGFNGGDPYFASADAATAVLNTNLATVSALLTWVLMRHVPEQVEEADVPRRRQRHDRGLGGYHPGRRFRQRLGRHARGHHRLGHRLDRLDLPAADPHQARRRRHGCVLHARHRRTHAEASWSDSSPTRALWFTRSPRAAVRSLRAA